MLRGRLSFSVPAGSLGWALGLALWLSGCASTPEKAPPTEGEAFEPETAARAALPLALPPSDGDRPATPPQPAPPKPKPAPKPQPKPWSVRLEHGSRRAVVDGVTLWLSEPARQNGDRIVQARPADQRASLDPLLSAGGAPFVQGRPMRILLDPGHGGDDPGALSRCRRHRESTHVLDIARRLSTYLTRAGFDVRLTRSDDATNLALEDRTAMARAWSADVFVSLHLNSAPGGEAEGMETFALPPAGMRATYQIDLPALSAEAQARIRQANPGNRNDDHNLRLAFCIQRRLVKATGRQDRGVRRARFAVLREATMPAVLVEAGFLSNRREAEFLGTPNGRERVARGIYQGLCDFATGRFEPGLPPAPVVPASELPPGH